MGLEGEVLKKEKDAGVPNRYEWLHNDSIFIQQSSASWACFGYGGFGYNHEETWQHRFLGCFDVHLSICSPGNNHVYSREFQSMLEGLDEEGCVEESGQISEKKRRLSVDQVKALEKNFEVENKLEPDRKVKLAQELGLQPRQVAVWFQNRRARWKTKQLERDYGVLKANYDSLKLNYDRLHHDNESLLKEIEELKSKLVEGNNESDGSVKEDEKVMEQSKAIVSDDAELNYESFSNNNGVMMATTFFPDFKDGSSDSDSSAILNETNSPISPAIKFNFSAPTASPSSAMNCLQLSDVKEVLGDGQKAYQPQFVKIEEHNFFGGDEDCNFFSDDQAPSLQWYCHDQWN